MKPHTALQSNNVATLHRELRIPPDYAQARGLSFQPEAELADLRAIAEDGERAIRLLIPAAAAWTHLAAAARNEGITLLPISGFRSIAQQTEIIRRKLANGHSLESILRINAAPGFSEHHTGRALDIGTLEFPNLEETFETTAAFTWLNVHALKFGFTLSYPRTNGSGIAYEPWHWCWK